MPTHNQRLLKIRVTRPAIALPFTEGSAFVVEEGLPADAELVGWDYSASKDFFEFVFQTEEAEVVNEMTPVPEQDITVRDLEPEDLDELDYIDYDYGVTDD